MECGELINTEKPIN